jgi:serine/threonine protein kinase
LQPVWRTPPFLERALCIIDTCSFQDSVLVNEAGHALLTDFGRSKVISEPGYSTPLLAGSAAYMAPELLTTGEENIDDLFSTKSDIYAFGMLCLEVSHVLGEKSFSHDIVQIFTNDAPFACYNARYDWQIVPLVQQGKRPMVTSSLQCCITANMWMLIQACWETAAENRPSVEQILQHWHMNEDQGNYSRGTNLAQICMSPRFCHCTKLFTDFYFSQ